MVPVGRGMPFVPSVLAVVGAGAARMSRDTPWCLEAFYLIPPGTHANEGIQVGRGN